MSLDQIKVLGKVKVNTSTTGITADPVDGDFPDATVMTDYKKATLWIDTSAGDVTITMAALDALTGVKNGDVIKLRKATTDSNKVIFVDGEGFSNEFVDVQGDYYCAERNAAGDWEV